MRPPRHRRTSTLSDLLLESLTGHRAFAQTSVHEAVVVRLSQDPVIPSSVGHDWGDLLTAMTARDPAQRPTAMEVVIAVNAMTPHPPFEQDTVATPAEPDDEPDHHATARASTLVAPTAPPTAGSLRPSMPRTLELDIIPPALRAPRNTSGRFRDDGSGSVPLLS